MSKQDFFFAHVCCLYQLVKEFERLIIVNKPHGLPFHQAGPGAPSVLNLVREHQADGRLPYSGRLWPVHRLDAVTSGILLLAKDQAAAGELVGLLRTR